MKIFLALTALASLVAGLPACPRRQRPNTPVYGNSTTGANTNTNTTITGTISTSNSTATKFATGWYPGWYSDKFAPNQIPWEKYSALTYAFACVHNDLPRKLKVLIYHLVLLRPTSTNSTFPIAKMSLKTSSHRLIPMCVLDPPSDICCMVLKLIVLTGRQSTYLSWGMDWFPILFLCSGHCREPDCFHQDTC